MLWRGLRRLDDIADSCGRTDYFEFTLQDIQIILPLIQVQTDVVWEKLAELEIQ